MYTLWKIRAIISSAFIIFSGWALFSAFSGGAEAEQAEKTTVSGAPIASNAPSPEEAKAGASAIEKITDKVADKPVITASAPVLAASEDCIVDSFVLNDLKKNREDIQAKQKALTAKEAELKARELTLNDKIKELEELRKQISVIQEAKKQQSEEKVNKLIETLESMNPKSGAQILANLDESLALAVMSGLTTLKLGKLISTMEPKRATHLTEVLAGTARARSLATASNGADEAVKKEKGGE